jgi:hypothetical protein
MEMISKISNKVRRLGKLSKKPLTRYDGHGNYLKKSVT